ncbi:hypothetical protein SAMN06265218_104109 [Fodinibius sediminis]|uniref:Uncharacterized protein n=1 Tax=Fodinibius sediminis TaxID=1214077 RepID=A0A521BWE4_9BACT|nr:hypothetical protein SAMN06265218_104109 [Fodinibius sediminis]
MLSLITEYYVNNRREAYKMYIECPFRGACFRMQEGKHSMFKLTVITCHKKRFRTM